MPELPEVETVRKGLEPVLVGAQFSVVEQRRPDLRFPFPARFAKRLMGQTVMQLERRAKYLLAPLSNDEVLVMHLGMSGRFIIDQKARKSGKDRHMPGAFAHAGGEKSRHDHVVFKMSNGSVIRYNDARRFGFMTLIDAGELEAHKFFNRLGVEPLSEDFTPEYLASQVKGKTVSLKAFLMDQRIIAGLGNIYVCEAMHRACLSPELVASCLVTPSGKPSSRAKKLVSAIKLILGEAIAAGGSTLRDHRRADGTLGYFQHAFAVYDREGEVCLKPNCKGIIRRLKQNGRSTFYCVECQL